jgi:hypothetical protein
MVTTPTFTQPCPMVPSSSSSSTRRLPPVASLQMQTIETRSQLTGNQNRVESLPTYNPVAYESSHGSMFANNSNDEEEEEEESKSFHIEIATRKVPAISPFSKWASRFCLPCCPIDGNGNVQTETLYSTASLAVESVAALQVFYWFQYIIHNPTCNFLFKCGCTWQWEGGWKNCNIWSDGRTMIHRCSSTISSRYICCIIRSKMSLVHVEVERVVDNRLPGVCLHASRVCSYIIQKVLNWSVSTSCRQ